MNPLPFGFLIRGAIAEPRRLVDHAAAFKGFSSLDDRADVWQEAYLSAFAFGPDFRKLLIETSSCKGFAGACWSAWLWFDLDADDVQPALEDARRLAAGLVERYRLDNDALLLFFSGAKGFHVGLPTSLWNPDPSPDFHRHARRFAEGLANDLRIKIDSGVYDRVRAFRAPNSKHPKTGLHKRRLRFDELLELSLDGILKLAAEPSAFELPTPPGPCNLAAANWQETLALVRQEAEGNAQRRAAAANGTPILNRLTLAFLREGAGEGDRHRLLFSAAANLAEYGCSPALAHALLTEAALDSGLSPADVRRQIDCGIAHNGDGPAASAAPLAIPAVAPLPPAELPKPEPHLVAKLAALWKQQPAVPPVGNDHGDGWEHPLDQLPPAAGLRHPPASANDGPYNGGF